MKVLILGNKNSAWLAQFFEYCIRQQDEVVFFADNSCGVEFDVFSKRNSKMIDLEEEDKKKFYMHSLKNKKNVINKYKDILKKYGPFDVINVQFVNYLSCLLAASLKEKDTKLVYSYWGSDLLRVKKLFLFRIRNKIKKGDWATFDNIDLQDRFNQVYGRSYRGRQECAYFGVRTIEDIETIKNIYSNQQIKEEWGIPQNKLCIAVGYNGIEEQQHLKVFAAINRMPEAYRNQMFLLVQMTYGGSKEYKDTVVDALKNMKLSYKVFLDYLPGKEVAKIRLITDLYINAQTTDAFSGSVCENLYCGNLVVNAEWLNYKELSRYDLKHVSFQNFEELTQVLQDCIDGKVQIDTTGNKQKMASLRLWSECAKRWHRILYEEELQPQRRL